MTKRTRKEKTWSERRITDDRFAGWLLRVAEHPRAGGSLYVVSRFNGRSLGYRALVPRRTRADLGKTDKEQRRAARSLALDIIADLAKKGPGALSSAPTLTAAVIKPGDRLTLGQLADAYAMRGSLQARPSYRREQTVKVRSIATYLGADRPVADLKASDLQSYFLNRTTGNRRRAAARGDLQALGIACNFAISEDLLLVNPLARIKMAKIWGNHTPRRPWLAPEAYVKLRATVGQEPGLKPAKPGRLRKQVRARRAIPLLFGVLLDLGWATGHRVSAILGLRWNDIHFDTSKLAPHGAIRWYSGRASNNKSYEHVLPMNPLALAAIEQWRAVHPGIGSALLFPSPKDPTQPIQYSTLRGWMQDAERLAGLPHQAQGGFHMLRRGWVTARKHLPVKDVTVGLGSRDPQIVMTNYQQDDPQTTLAVVMHGA